MMKIKKWALSKFKDIKILTFKNSDKKSSLMRVFKVESENITKLENLYKEYRLKKFRKIKGFNLIWEDMKTAIKKNNIPAVAHNSAGDLMFLMSHLEKRNSSDYLQYKKLVRSIFSGGIYDTKGVVHHLEGELYRKSLGELYNHLKTENEKTVSIGKGFELGSEVFHNAGYDAFVTGVAFLHLVNLIPKSKIEKEKFKVKMFRIYNFMIDFDSQTSDAITTEQGWVVLFNKDNLKNIEKNQDNSMNDLIKNFSKLYVEKKKNRPQMDKRFPEYDINAFWAFADTLGKKIKKSFEKGEIRMFDNPRAKYFGDNYMVALEVRNPDLIPKLKKIVENFGRLVTLEEAYKIYLELYNKKFKKEEK